MELLFKKVSHMYEGITKLDNFVAIKDINLSIDAKDEFIAVVGRTGSGKSTLINHMNGLILPTEGEIDIFGKVIKANKKVPKLKEVRRRVGLVFQFPEYQLFEETVLKDIMFGPLNFGASKEEAKEKALKAAKMVGLEDSLLEKSPFKLSGGQMRRVAIAGILAIDTDILVLDEPTRGLDPQGSSDVMEMFMRIHKEYHKTIVLITHSMDVVASYAKRVVVMKDGEIAFDGTKDDLFKHPQFDEFHLALPSVLREIDYLNKELGLRIPRNIYSLEELVKYLERVC